jgi:amino acid transporter
LRWLLGQCEPFLCNFDGITLIANQVATFVGADASVHLAEEVSNAAKNIPRAICASMLINGMVGFVMLVTGQ